MAENEKKTSVWLYIGIGCGAIVVLGGIAAVALGLWAARGLKNFEAEMTDPVARTEKVKKMLGTDHIPEGYHAMLGMKIPLLAEIVILTDEEPDQSGQIHGLGERSMIYVNVISLGTDEQKLKDYFEGKTDDPRVLSKSGINIDTDEIIGRGVVPVEGGRLMYVSQRGGVSTQGYTSNKGVLSVVLADCPEDSRLRMAIWSTPAPAGSGGEADLAGTPADPAAIGEFMGDFDFCG